MNSTKDEKFCGKMRKYFREYTEATGIHGLRYVSEPRSRTEKIVWVSILAISLYGFYYMVHEVMLKYVNSPVVVSFATGDTPLYEIPFPAITICPEVKYVRDNFNFTGVFYQLHEEEEHVDNATRRLFNYVSLLCKEDVSKFTNQTVDDTAYEAFDELKIDMEDILPICVTVGEWESCEELFVPIIVDEGICYSFNILGRHEIFRNHVYQFADYHNVPRNTVDTFNVDTGYSKSAGLETYPRRVLHSGDDNALTIILQCDIRNIDKICTDYWKGFRVLIHNPWEVPRLSKHFTRIPLKKIMVAAVQPELTTTSEDVRKFHPDKRKCYMSDERPLLHFQNYSQSNCLLECQTNYTLIECGCVAFYMPRNETTPICGSGSRDCLTQTKIKMRLKELELRIKGEKFCDCISSCTQLKYNVEISHSDFYFDEYLQERLKFPRNVTERWSMLKVYFKDEQFVTIERNELYGVSELISNFGGLLGLFTGFSLISLVEIVYFCTLRLYCNKRLYETWSGPAK